MCFATDKWGNGKCVLCQSKDDDDDINTASGDAVDEDLMKRLKQLKGPPPEAPSEADLNARLAKLSGRTVPTNAAPLLTPPAKTEQEAVDMLLSQLHDTVCLDKAADDDLERRFKALSAGTGGFAAKDVVVPGAGGQPVPNACEYFDDGTVDEVNELPWCTICQQDADICCLDCKDDGLEPLYCHHCFVTDHHDAALRQHRTVPYMPSVPVHR